MGPGGSTDLGVLLLCVGLESLVDSGAVCGGGGAGTGVCMWLEALPPPLLTMAAGCVTMTGRTPM